MYKKLLITESEKNHIKKLYGLSEEQSSDNSFFMDMIKQVTDYAANKKSQSKSLYDTTSEDSKEIDLSKVSAKGQELLNNPLFKKKLKEISKEINVGENSILKLMKHESGFDPSVKNNIGCVGLIQFCPDKKRGNTKTIAGKTYSLEELRNNLELQMNAIKEFWLSGYTKGKIKSPKDLYIYNFFPVAAGRENNFVLQTNGLSSKKIAKANPIFNKTLGRPIDTPLTVGDLDNYYKKTGMI